MNIKAVVTFEEIPDDLIINWDQTGIKCIPVSAWTMAEHKSKRVEVSGIEDKRQITATFAASLPGSFLTSAVGLSRQNKQVSPFN